MRGTSWIKRIQDVGNFTLCDTETPKPWQAKIV